MKTEELIYAAFLEKFENKNRQNIGTELEFPMLNLNKKPVEKKLALKLMQHCLANGFKTAEYDDEHNPAFIINADGDVLSFDNSYNNFEFSMEKSENLFEVSQRFAKLYNMVQEFLLPVGYTLCGMGSNPYKKYISSSFVPFDIYKLVRSFLSEFGGGQFHGYHDFPAYLSSVQTHLDVSLDDLPDCYTLFAKMDFLRAVLFSNSPAFDEANMPECVCFRDYLWEKSGFGSLAYNTGKVDGNFETVDDLVAEIMKRDVFFVNCNGNYKKIEPCNIKKFYDNSDADVIDNYLSFKNIEITKRGTLEVRSDCTQPVNEAFAPVAFNLGVLKRYKEIKTILDSFFEAHDISKTNTELRNDYIYNRALPTDGKSVSQLLLNIIEVAEAGLKERGLGEERLISPLYTRAETLTCPAVRQELLKAKGKSTEDIIKLYSTLN